MWLLLGRGTHHQGRPAAGGGLGRALHLAGERLMADERLHDGLVTDRRTQAAMVRAALSNRLRHEAQQPSRLHPRGGALIARFPHCILDNTLWGCTWVKRASLRCRLQTRQLERSNNWAPWRSGGPLRALNSLIGCASWCQTRRSGSAAAAPASRRLPAAATPVAISPVACGHVAVGTVVGMGLGGAATWFYIRQQQQRVLRPAEAPGGSLGGIAQHSALKHGACMLLRTV